MGRILRSILLCAGLLALTSAFAQEITFTATVDRSSFSVGENIKLTLTLTNARGGIGEPDLGGLVVVQGPFESSAFNFNNGRGSSTLSRTYLLTATQPGDFTIGAVKAQVGGGLLTSEPIRVHVEKGAAGSAGSQVQSQQQKQDRDLFATIALSRNKCYVGEQVVATYTLYCRYNVLELLTYDLPKLTGFWAEEIAMGDLQWESALQTINGLQYRVAVIKKQLLLPQRGGRLSIDPATLTCVVNRSFFSRGDEVKIRSNTSVLEVMELPPGRPADLSGAVGELKMVVSTGAITVKANEAIDIKLNLSGRANLKLIDAPKPAFPSDFETYAPKVVDKITVNAGGMSGSREFQYLVIPRLPGEYRLAPVTVSYFDPVKGAYKQLSSGELVFTVLPGDATTSGAATISRPEQTDVQQLDLDIRYIRTGDLGLKPMGDHLFGSWPFLIGIAAPALALILLFGFLRRRDKLMADVAGVRRKGADGVARKRLQEAATALAGNDRDAFYTAMTKALQGYLADKFSLGLAEITSTTARARLNALGATADHYASLLETCELARYAPVEGMPRKQVYEDAVTLITLIENELRA